MYSEISLCGTCHAELNTEVRFSIADARSSGIELVRLVLDTTLTESDSTRITNCLYKVLRAMMRSGRIQFFIPTSELLKGSTEAEFLINKYASYLEGVRSDDGSLLVKI